MKQVILAALALGATGLLADTSKSDCVDLFIGTGGSGHCHPCACRPFGFVQAGPDTGLVDWRYCSGYQHADTEFLGFSQNRISGSGCSDLGDALILPLTDEPARGCMKLPVDKASEAARPGYYTVTFANGVRVEATATARVALYRITYPKGAKKRLLVDFQYGEVVQSERGVTNRVLSCRAATTPTSAEAAMEVVSWTTRKTFAHLAFSRAATAVEELAKANPCEKAPRTVLTFGGDEPLFVKAALSTVSIESAKRNAAAELPGWDFDAVRAAAAEAWDREFDRVEVEGTDLQKTIAYTGLYHLFVQPHDITDADGRYRGADDRIRAARDGRHYSEISLWDTFRCAIPMYTLVAPEKIDPLVNSLVAECREQGYLPLWPVWGHETDCMIGNPSVSVIAEAYLKGFRGFDAKDALAACVKSMRTKHPKTDPAALDRYGYYPMDLFPNESVSMTLEDAVNAAAVEKLARALGDTDEADYFAKRAGAFRNHFKSDVGFFAGKTSTGAWRPNFDPLHLSIIDGPPGDFTEANAWHYLWHVQHDVPALMELLGGREAFLRKLDELFALPSHPKGGEELRDITGLIGQYCHGNEPCQHVAYLYTLAGDRDRAGEIIREICETQFAAKPDGVCGNEDNGQMSAWYLFAALGFYPVDPPSLEFVFGAPQLPKVTLKLGNGKTFTTVAKRLSSENRCIRTVSLNGKPVTTPYIRYEDIVAGGTLVYEMGPSSFVVRPTFNSCGLEFAGAKDDGVAVEYRRCGATEWTTAGRVVWFDRTETWRTSLIGLGEDTAYEVRVLARGKVARERKFRTWSSEVRVGETVEIDPKTAEFPIVVDANGKSDAWIRYTVKPGAKLVNATTNVTFDVRGAQYVLLDGLTVVGGRTRSAITVRDSRHVRIRNCDISGWGRTGPVCYDRKARRIHNGKEINFDGAIAIYPGSYGTVVESCYVHDPLCPANSWFYSHPTGTEAVMLWKPDHSTVIRWCDFVGSDLFRYNDAVESMGNFHEDGGFNRDADVYGNFMIFCNDDCIELDGGQRNVRCFGNRFESALCGVSIQGCMMSPVYVWDNLFSGMEDEFGEAGQTVKTGGGEHGKGAHAFLWENIFAGRGSGYQYRRDLRSVLESNLFAGNQTIGKEEYSPDSVSEGNVFNGIYDLGGRLEHPRRPAGFELDRGRFDGVRDGFSVTATATREVAFAVVWPEAMDWFAVEPMTGVMKPGEKTVFRVTLKKEKMNDRRHYRGAFLVRSADGLSRPVSFYSETGFIPPYRAEKPGETAVYAEVKGGTRLSSEPRTFAFDVPKAGRYYFLIHAKTPDRKPSVRTGVDGAERQAFRQQFTPYPSWVMLSPGGAFGNTIRFFDFEPGRHTVTVSGVESVEYDAIVLTDSPGSFEPR